MAALRLLLGLVFGLLFTGSLAAAPGDDDPFRDDPAPPVKPPAVAPPMVVPPLVPLPPREDSPLDRPAGPVTTRPLAEVPLDLARLEHWQTKGYRVYADIPRKWHEKGIVYIETEKKVVATINLTTNVRPDRIVLRDTWWNLTGQVKPYDIDVYYPTDSLFRARRIVFDPRHKPVTSDLGRGRYDLALPGNRRTGTWPSDTLTLAAMTRLVGLLPRDPGAGFTFAHYSPTPEIAVEENSDPIVCIGPDNLRVLRLRTDCTKFAWRDLTFWVRNCDGALARLDRPGYVSLILVSDSNPRGPCCQPLDGPSPAAPAGPAPLVVPPAELPPDAPAPPKEGM